MTTAEMAKSIGKKAVLRIEAFGMGVEILDVKRAYGNTRYLVEPLTGIGEAWVDENRLSNIGEDV
jgi:hypothetical protein